MSPAANKSIIEGSGTAPQLICMYSANCPLEQSTRVVWPKAWLRLAIVELETVAVTVNAAMEMYPVAESMGVTPEDVERCRQPWCPKSNDRQFLFLRLNVAVQILSPERAHLYECRLSGAP